MKVRIGLLAAARIAEEAVVEPARTVPGIEVTAIAARSSERASEYAERWSIPEAFGSYESMIRSDEVDAVYIATPATLHREWAIAAIEGGKHVLCEKPFAANAEDARLIESAAASSDRVVMEAFHWRYHPLVGQMRSVIDSGMLGEIRHMEARFDVNSDAILRSDIRWDLSLGGGSMMDIGCYPASWARWLFDEEPQVTSAQAQCPEPEIDGAMSAELLWPSGVTGSISGSMISEIPGHTASMSVIGTDATMIVDNPLAPQWGSSLEVKGPDGSVSYPVLPGTTYESQLLAFRDAVVFGGPFPTTASEGVLTMELIDACYRAAGLDPRPTHPEVREN